MTAILGLSCYYHDSAAALVVDGEIVAAAQEERFSRRKHDRDFPTQATRYCLEAAGLAVADLDHVAFHEKPLLKFDRLLETWLAVAPRGFPQFLRALPGWLKEKLHAPRALDRGLGGGYRGRYVFPEHHESHAASAFFPSPFEEAAILTLDGVGEWTTGSIGRGRGNRIELCREMSFPHSLGLLYSAFTYFTGFRVNSGEYKLMGLAPYGEPEYEKAIRDLIDLKEDGSFRLDMSAFAYCHGDVMTSPRMDALFSGPPRLPESVITQREMDIAASLQVVTEDVMLRAARHAHAITGAPNLVLAGGVALNCVGTGRILREGPFADVWVQPAAGDAGAALGAALLTWHQLLDGSRPPSATDRQAGSLLGPEFSSEEIVGVLDRVGASYRRIPDEERLAETVAGLLAAENVVGHFHGRMEFGPRALGNRSILGDARSPAMQSVLNQKIKFRESFRPFAPCVLREDVSDWFEMAPGQDSPYMSFVAPVRRDRCTGENEATVRGLDKLRLIRSEIPAVTHVDLTARLQTVDPERHGRLHGILTSFKRRTGCPVLINTSFNVRGEPIVCTPADAWRCFMATDMDALVLGDALLLKSDQVDGSPRAGAP